MGHHWITKSARILNIGIGEAILDDDEAVAVRCGNPFVTEHARLI